MKKISISTIKKFIFIFAIYQIIAMISGLITQNSIETWYININKATFNPPSYIFPIIWTLLYTMLAFVAVYLWENKKSSDFKNLFTLYLAQMILNWSWTPVFFYFNFISLAALILVSMVIINAILIYQARIKHSLISYLLTPYLLWLIFATYLNISILLLN